MWSFILTEGKGFCRRRQERKAEEQVKRDLANLDKIVIIENKNKPKKTIRFLHCAEGSQLLMMSGWYLDA
jgi:hypothetical protein